MKSLFCAALAALAAFSGEGWAETFVVTRFDDPLPDTCAVGDCSLREAAIAATANDPFGPVEIIQLARRHLYAHPWRVADRKAGDGDRRGRLRANGARQ